MEKETTLNLYDADGFPKCCPHGASINYPKEPLRKIHIGTINCQKCLLFNGFVNDKQIVCKY